MFEGQFTGMHDKNGQPLHEGDTVRFYHKGQFVNCTIIYDIQSAMFCLKWPDGYINRYPMNPDTYEKITPKGYPGK
jgi:hypothetical protein